MRTIVRLAAALVLVLLSGCDSGSEPQGVEGRYGVYSVNGNRPPAAVRGDPGGAQVQVVDAELTLAAPNHVSVELATRVVAADGGAGATTRTTYAGTYQLTGDVLVLGWLDAGGIRALAEGVVISPREVAVTLHVPVPAYQGYYTYPVALVLRR